MRRSAIKRRPLADSVLDKLEPETREYRELDSPGLYFRVLPSGSKNWQARYKTLEGKWLWKGIGRYPEVSGKLARKLTRELRELVADGKDPQAEQTRQARTVETTAREFYAFKQLSRHALHDENRNMQNSLISHLCPLIGHKKLGDVTRIDCREAIETIEKKGVPSVAKYAAIYLKAMYSWAIATGYCEINPASELRHVMVKHPVIKHPFLLEEELGEFLFDFYSTHRVKRPYQIVLDIIMRTMARPHMVLHMTWEELDLKRGLWSVPGSKMKMNEPYVTPLSRQVVSLLNEQAERPRLPEFIDSPYVFTRFVHSTRPKANPKGIFFDNAISSQLRRLGYKGRLVPHGMRHTGRTLLGEHQKDGNLAEAQMAHKVSGVEGIYNNAKYIEPRRELMQWYNDYLDFLFLDYYKSRTTGDESTNRTLTMKLQDADTAFASLRSC